MFHTVPRRQRGRCSVADGKWPVCVRFKARLHFFPVPFRLSKQLCRQFRMAVGHVNRLPAVGSDIEQPALRIKPESLRADANLVLLGRKQQARLPLRILLKEKGSQASSIPGLAARCINTCQIGKCG